LESIDASYIVPLSDDAAIHDKILTHVTTMSSDGRRPRRAFAGAALNEKTPDLANYLNRTLALNSDRVALIAQGIKVFNDQDQLITLAPYFAAAQIAGMQAGLPEVGEPLTHKSIEIVGLEWVPTGADLELMIEFGVLPIALVENRGFFRIERGITTWRKNDAFHRVEISTGVAVDEVIRRVVQDLEDRFIGHKASPVVVYRVVSATETILKLLQGQNIIVGDA